MHSIIKRLLALAVVSALCAPLSGCAVGVALLGAGATAGAAHHMEGIRHRTFTEPLLKVEAAVYAALVRMGITVESAEKVDQMTVIKGSTAARSIEVQLEHLTPQATRMRSVAYQSGGMFVDASTGVEIISQTEFVLANNARLRPVVKRGA